MLARSFILAAIAATQLPFQALAQGHGFVGVGVGASHVSTEGPAVAADNRASWGARAGYGSSRVKIVLDYQQHGLGDEEPLVSDWPVLNVTPTRVPQVLGAEYLLLGAQINVTRALYLRPALGVGRQSFATYISLSTSEGVTDSAYVAKEGGPAAGLSLGYNLKVHPRVSLGIETSLLLTSLVEGGDSRKAFGIQVTPLLSF
jgi:hypothetical protein